MSDCSGATLRTKQVGMGTAGVNGSLIRFGLFEVDVRAGELRRNGSKIKLQEQPFQILTILLERPGEVVTRDELRAKLWPADTFVDFDHSLNAAVRRLRDALGDSAENPRFVETVARRGYRFVAPVSLPPAAIPILSNGSPVSERSSGFRASWRTVLVVAAILGAGIFIGYFAARTAPSRPSISQRRLTANPSDDPVSGAVLSPDGRYLIFSDSTGCYVRQVDTGETHSLALPKGFGPTPLSWFPDGAHVLAIWAATPKEPANLWSISTLGGEPKKLADNALLASVSPDGATIAYVPGAPMNPQIWLMQSSGEKAKPLTADDGKPYGGIAWSPDGKKLAFVHYWFEAGKEDMESEVQVRDLDTGRTETLVQAQSGPSFRGCRHLRSCWSLGSALAWTSDNRLLYSQDEAPPNQDDFNLWALRLDPRTARPEGAPVQVTHSTGDISSISVSADSKRVAITRYVLQPDVYIADIEDGGAKLSTPRRLTLDERKDYPFSWTPDGKSVIFISDRDGPFHIFRQAIDSTTPDLLVGGKEQSLAPRLSPDGKSLLYVASSGANEPARPNRVMRLSLDGGPPQEVLEDQFIFNLQCARLPSTLCLYGTIQGKTARFFTFDPFKGRTGELPKLALTAADSYFFNWSLSPDGRFLAQSRRMGAAEECVIRVEPLSDLDKEKILRLPFASGVTSMDWAADAKSLWVTTYVTTGARTLFKVDLQGHARPMLQESTMQLGWAIPSLDGKRLALWEASGSSNVWMVENF